eukprot:CAMPEP_0118700800 /NCGR_PEP_ID=MMETSP0800-20121206/16818_1 /TAXON_ID=210618 ORGANISM="Striatella unipunctata, Strain CCMP2910" /NCGR_SAMPLE_ID=MMETSP0800 /ASSEMBLY_ACC=CAM_ASM_000638 /LENGTH=100 /DNA_ID=CAMNT_0006601493 /DNA_START=174 /DNA_END=476 /DNA_ORIENTATION=-
MNFIQQQMYERYNNKYAQLQNQEQRGVDNTRRPISHNQALVTAMIDNATSSTPRENLSNAFDAHERFIIGDSAAQTEAKFMKKILKRKEELMNNNNNRNF